MPPQIPLIEFIKHLLIVDTTLYYVLNFINFLPDTGDFDFDSEVQTDEEDSNDLELPTGYLIF